MLKDQYNGIYTKLDDWIFDYEYAYELLINHFKTQSLKGFGVEEMRTGIVAAGAVMNYLQETQKANLPHIQKIVPDDVSAYMVLPSSTVRNLEIVSSLGEGGRQGTLLAILDRTQTPMGGRLLKKWITRPLKILGPILERQKTLSLFVADHEMRREVKQELRGVGDLERLIAKITTGRATPREVTWLNAILQKVPRLRELLARVHPPLADSLHPLEDLVALVQRAIVDDPPVNVADGGVIRKGFSSELDELREVAHSGKTWIANLQSKERQRTGIPSLKVGFNNVFGYYIEVTNTHKNKVPDDYERKQTLTNAERYVTPELQHYEERVLGAEETSQALETELFKKVRERVAGES